MHFLFASEMLPIAQGLFELAAFDAAVLVRIFL
jgi:hypothetical protein